MNLPFHSEDLFGEFGTPRRVNNAVAWYNDKATLALSEPRRYRDRATPMRFAGAVRSALPAAAAGSIVTFGVKPTYPASSYGYIRAQPAEDDSPVRKVAAFVEKPDAATATRYVADGPRRAAMVKLFGDLQCP